MDRTILLIFIAAIVGAGVVAGATGLFVGSYDSWSPRQYVLEGDDCYVKPQGDPLYDEHYAKNVNLPNCEAYEMQEQAQYTQEQAQELDWQTTQNKIATWGFVLVIAFIIVFIVAMALRG